ncbi:MAG: aspartate kinase [Candidatus Gastranaerophilales bacterium]|nr:aspartate kinase [Candidatus Gastranaerophilales bacterium]
MSIVVQKFGGTSVADPTKIKNVAQAVIREKEKGHQVVVVVSAMGKTTDYLVDLASEISPNPSLREMDMLLTTGEQVSIALLTMAIQQAGHRAISMNAAQIGIITENVHSKARIVDIKTKKLKRNLDNGLIVVAAGFQGITPDGEITTLGRGGSDTSAVALASALGAERCDIYTDVDAVYTADPRVVPTASRLDVISYEEMLELARVGANVLHPRSVETAKQFSMPMRVRSSFNHQDLGTLIIGVEEMEIYRPVSGVAADLSQVKVAITKVPDKPGSAAKIFSTLADNNISVDMIIQSYGDENNIRDMAFTVDESDSEQTMSILNNLQAQIGYEDVVLDRHVAKISIVGAGMIDKPGVAADMFSAIADTGINIKMISTSEIKISCIIDKDYAKEAVKALHDKFELNADKEAKVQS